MVPVGTPLTGAWLTQAEPLLVSTFPLAPGDVKPVPPEEAASVDDNPPATMLLWFIHDGAAAPFDLSTCPLEPAASMTVVLRAL